MTNKLKVKLTNKNAKLPYRASSGAAAYDLFACIEEDVVIPPGGFCNICTGIAIELPCESCVALIFSRSGHGTKHGISLVNSVGVVDSDYRGELVVGLINHGSEPFTVSNAERIAQLMITSCVPVELVTVTELSDTERGRGGFGSTGTK